MRKTEQDYKPQTIVKKQKQREKDQLRRRENIAKPTLYAGTNAHTRDPSLTETYKTRNDSVKKQFFYIDGSLY